jgi:hypothetical protein|tara:strand:- start:1255 stop:1953 length:699 start_codon:yes stop_codon:yes gene_type:complete|eukprot:COSAG01_NODE_250_length_20331_cov_203.745700_20_plen_233_part_00
MRVLEARECGHGILVEHDGYISPDDNKNIISEMKSNDFGGEIYMNAILQKFDTPNRNGRIYPEKILKRENERYQEIIKKGGAISELNHPESSLIDLDRASHIITETWWDGNRLIGKLKLLTSPGYIKEGIISCVGDQAANLLRQGVTLGISSRGVGSLTKNGEYNQVQEDFELICFDLVSSPSTPGSYLFKEDESADSVDETGEVVESSNPPQDNFNKSLSMMSKLDNFLNR